MELLLRTAIQAAIDAGNAIMKVYETEFEVETKSDNSPLTMADRNANELINGYLSVSGIPIISEENSEIDYAIRKAWTQCWIVDPLDGTKEFVKRNGEFTVNIALVNAGVPVLGVMYVPVARELYFAKVKDNYFSKATIEGTETVDQVLARAVRMTQPVHDAAVVRVVASRSHMNEETRTFIDQLQAENSEVAIVSKGSALKFCLVAEGNADIYPRFAPTMEWDTAAAHAICNAVGIKVLSLETGKELVYNKENLLNPWFVCKY